MIRAAYTRRMLLTGALAGTALMGAARVVPIRIGVVQSGTAQWIVEVIRRRRLDAERGLSLDKVMLASPEAGRIALMGGQVDMVVLDWPFVAARRNAGTRLCFAPMSSATGDIMCRAGSGIDGLAGLAGKRLGVAGGPLDKSWLVVQAAARKQAGIDLAAAARVDYGAPPLLEAKLIQGELDAVLTFWNFAARLDARGYTRLVSVAECAQQLGLQPGLGLVGFVFHQDWAEGTNGAVDDFLAAARQAADFMATSDDDWQAVRPLLGVPDDATAARLRARFAAGIAALPDPQSQEREAARLLSILRDIGGLRATDGMDGLPAGTFWRSRHGAG